MTKTIGCYSSAKQQEFAAVVVDFSNDNDEYQILDEFLLIDVPSSQKRRQRLFEFIEKYDPTRIFINSTAQAILKQNESNSSRFKLIEKLDFEKCLDKARGLNADKRLKFGNGFITVLKWQKALKTFDLEKATNRQKEFALVSAFFLAIDTDPPAIFMASFGTREDEGHYSDWNTVWSSGAWTSE